MLTSSRKRTHSRQPTASYARPRTPPEEITELNYKLPATLFGRSEFWVPLPVDPNRGSASERDGIPDCGDSPAAEDTRRHRHQGARQSERMCCKLAFGRSDRICLHEKEPAAAVQGTAILKLRSSSCVSGGISDSRSACEISKRLWRSAIWR